MTDQSYIDIIDAMPPPRLSARQKVFAAFDKIEAEHAAGRRYVEIAESVGVNYTTFLLYVREMRRERRLIASIRAQAAAA
jgi:hypothetical protein